MATKPMLWYQVDLASSVFKLSDVPPYNECTVRFSCNKDIAQFRAWSVFGKYTGEEKGLKIVEFTNRPKDVELSFKINRAQHLTLGEGLYSILLFVQDTEGLWNQFYFFFTTEANGTNLRFCESDGDPLEISDPRPEPEPL